MAKQYKRKSTNARHFTVSVALRMIKRAISPPKSKGQKRAYDMSYDSQLVYLLTTAAVPLVFCGMVLAHMVSFAFGLTILSLAGVLQAVGLFCSIKSFFDQRTLKDTR